MSQVLKNVLSRCLTLYHERQYFLFKFLRRLAFLRRKHLWHGAIIVFIFINLITGFSPFDLAGQMVKAFGGHEVKSINFYPSKCVVDSADAQNGWQTAELASGEPSIELTKPDNLYNRQNSAYFNQGTSTILCSNFSLAESKDNKTEDLEIVATTSEITATATPISEASPEYVATGTLVSLDGETKDEVKKGDISTNASVTPKMPEIIIEEVDASSSEVVIIDPVKATDTEVEIVPTDKGGNNTETSVIVSFLNSIKSSINFAKLVIGDFVTRVQESATAEKQEVNPARYEDIGFLKSAKINLSMAEVNRVIPKILVDSKPATTSLNVASTSDESPEAIKAIASTTPQEKIDTSGAASTTEDNAVIVDLYGNNVEQTKENEKVGDLSVWYSVNNSEEVNNEGRIWWKLGELPIDGILSCQKFKNSEANSRCLAEVLQGQLSAGFFSFEAPVIKRWQDITNLQIKIESAASADKYEIYLDSSWVSVNYTKEDDDSEDGGYAVTDKLVVGDQTIDLSYTDENADENLLIKTNSKDYVDITNATVYFSVANQASEPENVNVQVHFPADMGSVYKLERLRHGRWAPVEIKDQPISEPNIVQKVFGRGKYKRKNIKENMRAKNSTNDGGILINPGRAQYYRMVIQYPAMSKGEFFIEAEGDKSGYGLLDPWWDGYWHYKMPITINNASSTSALTDYQVLINISSTTPNFWSGVTASGSDIRFLDSTETTQLTYWTQYFTKVGSSTSIWVKVPSVPANSSTTIYLYYGNPVAAYTSDMYSTFSYSVLTPAFYMVNNETATATLRVTSLIDNNQIQLDNQTAVNLNRQQTATLTSAYATSVLKVLGPVMPKIVNRAAAESMVPISFNSTEFAVPQILGATENFYTYSPFGRATTSYFNGNVVNNTKVMATSTATTSSFAVATAGMVTSTIPILLSFTDAQPTSLIPYPTTNQDLYGIKSSTVYIGASATSSVNAFCSVGTGGVNTVNRGTVLTSARCTGSAAGAGSAMRLTQITGKIAAVQYNDGDGLETTSFLPASELATEYMVPTQSQYIAIACPANNGTVNIARYSEANVFVSSTTCASTATNPGKALFTATTSAGSRVVSTDVPPKPFYAYYEDLDATGTAGGDESNLWGAVQARKDNYPEPVITFGAQQRYVINVSGNIYKRDRSTPLLSAPVINLVYGRSLIATTAASIVNGSYVFGGVVAPDMSTTTLVYIASTTVSGVAYNRYSGSGDITGFDVYQNGVIIRHDDSGPMTNTNIDSYDFNQDAQIKMTVTSPNAVVAAGNFLYIWPNDTYLPGGTLTTTKGTSSNQAADIIIGASSTLNMAALAITAAGGWYNSGRLITSGVQTTTFTATSTGYNIINNGTSTFYNLTINGTAGGWTTGGLIDVTNAFTLTAGALTLGSPSNLIVDGASVVTGTIGGVGDANFYGNLTGDGAITMASGTFMMASTSNLAGITARSFYNLTFGDGRLTPATTTRSVSTGGITVNHVLSIAPNQYFVAGSANYTLNGTGTPFNLQGTLVPQTSLFRYAGTSSPVTITTTRYNNLQLAPGTAGGQLYTINTGALYMNGYLTIGDGVNAATVNASTTNPIIDMVGNFTISPNATFFAPTSSLFAIMGSWANSGTGRFVHASGTVTFDASTTGKTIAVGTASPFNNVYFNGVGGGWTINANATTTGDFTLATGTSFLLSPTVTLEVRGNFWNNLKNASTTWTGSTLYLNDTGSSTINSKLIGGDNYATLRLGASANIRMWDSTSTIYTVPTNASLYSMDASTTLGSLWIWGDYYISTGTTEYWQNKVDFDGADISAAPRQVNVRLAANATTTINGGSLNIIGSSTATTTIASQNTNGFHTFNMTAGNLNANYYQFRNLTTNGLNFSGSPLVNSLNNGDYQMSIALGSMIRLTPSVLDTNPGLIINNCSFATSSSVSTGYNVYLSASTSNEWHFNGLLGNRSGESFDFDPSDPRGNIVWDDSPSYTPKSQDWRWYYDESLETPVKPAAGVNIAPSNVIASSTLKLRMDIKETVGLGAGSVKMRLQYSTSPTFATNVNFVGEIGSTTALWTYDNGIDIDGAMLSTTTLASSTLAGTHNESGTTTSSFTQTAFSVAEFEFTLRSNGAATGTIYYFRAYTQSASGSVVSNNTGYVYPSIVPGDSAIASVINGLSSGTTTCGVLTNVSSAANTIGFGSINFATQYYAAHRLAINTNAEGGYQIFVLQNQDLTKNGSSTIAGIPATNDAPAAWSIGTNVGGFGYHTSDPTLSGVSPSRFAADNTYARLEKTMQEIGYNPLPSLNDSLDIIYRMEVTNQQPAGDYVSSVEYIVVPTY
ncbi:MAG: DUF2341 domain-containing protein [bacterium]